jgi:peptidoglycan hydrolase-like protein with peptidoglycan-binding domain
MLFASKALWTGIVVILLPTWLSGPRPTSPATAHNSGKTASTVWDRTDVKKMQQTLQGKGHYAGKVDGVFGLRTQASIRAYQKSEDLPITGQFDAQTADKLGVSSKGREEPGYEATTNKPSAGTKRKASTVPRKAVKTGETPRNDAQ